MDEENRVECPCCGGDWLQHDRDERDRCTKRAADEDRKWEQEEQDIRRSWANDY